MHVVPAGQLIDMPLHAITEVLGEEGLRARFILEIGKFDPPDRIALSSALGLATDLHRCDRRVREPYINHLLRVATRMICHYEVFDADVIIAGLLHDAVEDHPHELGEGIPLIPNRRQAAFSALKSHFGPRVAHLVSDVTNPEFDPEGDADQQYLEHLSASLERSPWARVIKASDFTDNGVGIIYITGPKAFRAAAKYSPLIPLLRDMIGRPNTPLSRWVKQHIFDQLNLAEERFSNILA